MLNFGAVTGWSWSSTRGLLALEDLSRIRFWLSNWIVAKTDLSQVCPCGGDGPIGPCAALTYDKEGACYLEISAFIVLISI